MDSIKKVCVFCASSPGIDIEYFKDAEILGRTLVDNGIHINYGGGSSGLMGRLADTVLQAGGSITGIIPGFMKQMNWAHPGVNDMIEVASMHERKQRMIENVDAVIALPGGVGTLEELAEVITLKQLGQFFAPIIIINTRGFYDHLLDFLHKMADESFIRHIHKEIWTVVKSPEMIHEAIHNSPQWDGNAIQFAKFEI